MSAPPTKTIGEQDDSLLQGGPGDQAGPADDPRNTGLAGSQQGRPQRQEDATVQRRAKPRSPAASAQEEDREDDRAVSDMERQAGTPDDRATTDWAHGEGEPPITPPSNGATRR